MQAYDYINSIPKFSKKASVSNTKRMLMLLGNPEKYFSIIHVAGTNGKGSVCSFLSNILMKSGVKTGLFTSPHLMKMNERISVSGEDISDEDFEEAFLKVKEVSLRMQSEGDVHPSFFEFLFGMAMYHFMKKGVEAVILETGLGGRLDATNAVTAPILTVITSISLDHTDILGDTVEKIAFEKAGIIKPGCPVVFTDTDERASKVIRNRAEELGCEAIGVNDFDVSNVNRKDINIDFCLNNEYYCNVRFCVHSYGVYQIINAATAATAAAKLAKMSDFKISPQKVADGIRETEWPGRMQALSDNFIVDGAHNDDGIKKFIESVSNDCFEGERTLLFSVVSDKHYTSMIDTLIRADLFSHYVVCKINDNRALDTDTIRDIFRELRIKPQIAKNVREGIQTALEIAGQDGRVYCAGSLYLVGEILREYKEIFHD